MEAPKNVLIENVEFMYPRLASPIENPFSKKMQYEMLIVVPESRKAELEANHLSPKPVKDRDGFVGVSVRRNAVKANGEDNGKVRVVDADKQPIEAVSSIGNGSSGNVILFQYPWENMGRKGISSSLTAVQVVDLKVYEASDSVDFDIIGGSDAPAGESSDLF